MLRALRAAVRRGGEAGSGTAIGVAVIFPMLMLVIMAINAMTSAARSEQALQAAADRAAQAATVCCAHVAEAGAAARLSLARFQLTLLERNVECFNDVSSDATVWVEDVDGLVWWLPSDGTVVHERDGPVGPVPVPVGGSAWVRVHCDLAPRGLGSERASLLTLGSERIAVGRAVIDPYRSRSVAAP